jgi:two-component system, NtrC family, sensor kinase
MEKTIALLVILFIVFQEATAQNNLPPVYEIKTDTAYLQIVPKQFWQMLPDKGGKLEIDDVSKLPLADQFFYPGQTTNADTIENVYWLRYQIKNTLAREAKISLTSMSDYDDFYLQKPGGGWTHFSSGTNRELDKKDGLKYVNIIPIILKPGEGYLAYNRIENKSKGIHANFDIYIAGTEAVIREDYIEKIDNSLSFDPFHMQEAFVLGLLFLTIFLNLFFYRIVHEKVYLYFALFSLFLGINRLYNIMATYLQFAQPDIASLTRNLRFAWAFIPYFLILFFREFLHTKKSYPRWDKLLAVLGIMNVITIFLPLIAELFSYTNPVSFIGSFVAVILVPICLIVTLLLFIRNKEKTIRFVIAGAIPLLLFYLLTELYQAFNINIPIIDQTLKANYRLIEVICISWFVISFSMILLLRFNLLLKQNAQHTLDKERLNREKEIEKNELIEKQKALLEIQVIERTAELNKSLENLKSTQSQLIQSEKMASLGELTAGIAHEIQNPLNFVNNFSEVSQELVKEMNDELAVGNIQLAKEIAGDIELNLEKINHHGKRADAIVKGMLQHSRASSGVKEPTDINALADEYLRLAYHGFRAKDKDFNATWKTDFDETIGKIDIVPQDIGRVILNLITNAFYAVDEKKKQAPLPPKGGIESPQDHYEPTVTVSTKLVTPQSGGPEGVKISVKDNGPGIPQKVLDKIFQPFFTTKPTGQGTGLGLSLAFDIVKAHGGEINVLSDAEGTVFIIKLKYQND